MALLLLFLLIFHLVSNAIILKETAIAPVFDAYDYLSQYVGIRHDFSRITNVGERPPFPLLVGALTFWLCDPSWKAAVILTNLLFLLLLAFSTYRVARNFFGAAPPALLAGCLVSFVPIIFAHSRLSMMDLGLTAMVAWFYSVSLVPLSRRWWISALIIGISLFLGLMTKPLFAVFTLPALVFLVATRLVPRLASSAARHAPPGGSPAPSVIPQPRQLFRWLELLVIALLGAGLSLPYYLHNLGILKRRFFVYNIPLSFEQMNPEFSFFLRSFCQELLGPGLFLLSCVGAVVCLIRFRQRLWPLLLWLVLPYLVLSCLPFKEGRYAMPLLPVLVILAAAVPFSLKGRWRRIVVGVLLLGGMAQQLILSTPVGLRALLPWVFFRSYERATQDQPWRVNHQYINNGIYFKDSDDWQVMAIVNTLRRCKRVPAAIHFIGCPAMLEYGVRLWYLIENVETIEWYLLATLEFFPREAEESLRSVAPKAVLLCENEDATAIYRADQLPPRNPHYRGQWRTLVREMAGHFEVTRRIPLPEWGQLTFLTRGLSCPAQ